MKNLCLPLKFLIILLSLALTSCMLAKEEKSQMRIVDLQGNSRKVTTRYPALNVEALSAQGKIYDQTGHGAFSNSVKVSSSKTYVKKTVPVKEVFTEEAPPKQNITEIKEDQSDAADSGTPLLVTYDVTNGVTGGSDETDLVVEYDLSDSVDIAAKKKVTKKVPSKEITRKNTKKTIVTRGQYFVQVGSFTNKTSAKFVLTKMKKFHSGTVKTSLVNKRQFHRVWLGPFSSRASAKAMVTKITKSGSAAILVKDK